MIESQIGILYRYPHPFKINTWLYIGQGSRRDHRHRSGKTSFGRRFLKQFPDIELPRPEYWAVEILSQMDLNEEETIAMFKYHTWYGLGGMNLEVPGSSNYKNMGVIGGRQTVLSGHLSKISSAAGRIGGLIGGKISGRKNVENGLLARIRTREGSIKGGRKNVESGHLQQISAKGGYKTRELYPELAKQNGRIGGLKTHILHPELARQNGYKGGSIGRCKRWQINRGLSCICGRHQIGSV